MEAAPITTEFDYAQMSIPPQYRCGVCDMTGCKLWLDQQEYCKNLLCVDCAEAKIRKGRGLEKVPDFMEQRWLQIGGLLPAVPYQGKYDSYLYFRHSKAPQSARDWWLSLPTRVEVPRASCVAIVSWSKRGISLFQKWLYSVRIGPFESDVAGKRWLHEQGFRRMKRELWSLRSADFQVEDQHFTGVDLEARLYGPEPIDPALFKITPAKK